MQTHGPTQHAFTFKTLFEPDQAFLSALDWSAFVPCPAA
jgi:hypothetical protein